MPSPPVKPAQATQTTQPQEALVVVGIKDKLKALDFANKAKQDKNSKAKETDYKGQKITENPDSTCLPKYTAVVKDHLVIASNRSTIEQAIDASSGQPSFASKQDAKKILTKGVDVNNTLVQVYLPDYPSLMQQLATSNPGASPLSPEALKQLAVVKSAVVGVGVDDNGIRMKAVTNLDPELNKFEYQNSQNKILATFPANTLLLINGSGINRAWSALTEQAKTVSDLQQGLLNARQQLQTAGIDLDKDIFSWMDGEYAFAAIPSNQGLLAFVGFGGTLVFDTSDRKTAEATLAKLDNLAKTNQVNIAQRDVGDKKITEWQTQQGSLLAHGWLDNDTVFVALGSPMADAIANRPPQNLENSENFKTIAGSLPKSNAGYFYLDMDQATAQINRFIPPTPEVNAILGSIRGISAVGTSIDKSTVQAEMLIALKPKAAK